MGKGWMDMMGTFIIFLAAVYLLLTFAWIMKDPDIEKGLGSKSYHMLLLLFMKADLALAAGMEYAKLTLERICKGYRRPVSGAQRLSDKRERILNFRCQMAREHQNYRQRKHYNRKIPG